MSENQPLVPVRRFGGMTRLVVVETQVVEPEIILPAEEE